MSLKVPLLLGLIVLMGRVWTFEYEFYDIRKTMSVFLMSMEYALFRFNQDNKDEFAYKLLWIHQSKRKRFQRIFLMDVELARTICRKNDDDIENCPLQEGQEAKKLRCIFLVDSDPWTFEFTLLKSTCEEK